MEPTPVAGGVKKALPAYGVKIEAGGLWEGREPAVLEGGGEFTSSEVGRGLSERKLWKDKNLRLQRCLVFAENHLHLLSIYNTRAC